MRFARPLPWIAASLAAAFAAAALLPGCRVSTSFRGPGYSRDAGGTLEDDDEVVVVVTYAQLDNTRRRPSTRIPSSWFRASRRSPATSNTRGASVCSEQRRGR